MCTPWCARCEEQRPGRERACHHPKGVVDFMPARRTTHPKRVAFGSVLVRQPGFTLVDAWTAAGNTGPGHPRSGRTPVALRPRLP